VTDLFCSNFSVRAERQMGQQTEVVIIGAGPYGLSIAAQLRARGVQHRIFGPPMKFWRDMPAGVNLKSPAFAAGIYSGRRGQTFDAWCRQNGIEDFEPCSMADFTAYADDMQKKFVPEVEAVLVTHVSKTGDGFNVALETGEHVRARNVVIATGLSYLARAPEILKGLPEAQCRHTSTISDYSEFNGKTTAVIGGGASAIEAGAMVKEGGGTAEVFIRASHVTIHNRTPRRRPLKQRLTHPWTALGPGRMSWIMQSVPPVAHLLPIETRKYLGKGFAGPSAPWWIKERVEGVPIHVRHEVVAARAAGDKVELTVRGADNAERTTLVDVVIAGTGYVNDPSRLAFLDRALVTNVQLIEGAPLLDKNFQSSVPGLYFTGHHASVSFGPLFKFVAGAKFTANALSRHFAGQRPHLATAVGAWLAARLILARHGPSARKHAPPQQPHPLAT
jgi:FAD-dependent urate hydroxylase